MIGFYLAVREKAGGYHLTNATDGGLGNVVARMDVAPARNKAVKRKLALGTYAAAAEAEKVLEWLMGNGSAPDVEPMPEMDEDFPERLTALRESAGLSIPDLARRADISDDSIRLYEAGTRSPSWQIVQKIATALGVSTDTFRTG